MSNSLYLDQEARRYVGPALGPNCLQSLLAETTKKISGTCKELRNLRVLFVSPEDNALSSSSLTLRNPLFYS